jgi:hypothetical protein
MQALSKGNFEVIPRPNSVVIRNKKSEIELAPAESAKVAEIVAMAVSMGSCKVLPPLIRMHPFEVKFSEDGLCLLSRIDSDKGLVFSFDTGDTLIQAIDMGATAVIDNLRLRGGARAGVGGMKTPDPLIEGR